MNKILGVAINEYDHEILNNISNCINDLNEIVGILKSKYQFDDFLLLSKKEQTTRKYLHNIFYDYFLNCSEEDCILLIYNGHGQYIEQLSIAYWQPSDSDPLDKSSWFNLNELLDFIRISPARHISIISNTCFSGAIFDDPTRGGGTAAFNGKKSRLALTAGSIEPVSDGKSGTFSPFTETVSMILANNVDKELTFISFANQVILSFNKNRAQTPMFGPLTRTGHCGGAFIFELMEAPLAEIEYTNMSLGLNIDLPIKLDYECNIPFFSENRYFDNLFVNTYIQKIAFDVISETRGRISKEKEFMIQRSSEIPFDLSIGYRILTLDQNFLSLLITVHTYFGGAYPDFHFHTLNISYKPERKLNFYELVKYSDLQTFLKKIIGKYGNDKEHKQALNQYRKYFTYDNIEFTIEKDYITLYFTNLMPKAIKALSFLTFPKNYSILDR